MTALNTNTVGASWIVDLGATNHMISNLELLHSYHENSKPEKSNVHLPTGSVVPVSRRGSSKVLTNQLISNVLFYQVLNLICSVSKLTKESQCSVAFFLDFCIFQDLYTGVVKGIGREDQGLYILKGSSVIQTPSVQ